MLFICTIIMCDLVPEGQEFTRPNIFLLLMIISAVIKNHLMKKQEDNVIKFVYRALYATNFVIFAVLYTMQLDKLSENHENTVNIHNKIMNGLPVLFAIFPVIWLYILFTDGLSELRADICKSQKPKEDSEP